jgi:hypothetical protein
MVWSQYVYEATVGLDHIPSDEEDYEDDFHLSIEDWQTKYSDELWELWRIVEQLIHDAFLEYELMTECTFSDFAEFCSTEHTDDCDFVWIPYESNLSYIWRHIQEYLEDTGLYNEIMPGATYDHWVRFVFEHSKQNNLMVY